MSSVGLRVSNVTVDKAVRIAQSKIPPKPDPIANEVYTDSFISFNNMNPITKELIITGDNALSMAKSGLLIVDYQPNIGISVPYTLLFGLENTPSVVNNVAFVFNLSNQTPSRLIRVIRSGITPLFYDKDTILGTEAVVIDQDIKYIYFQVNGIGEYTRTPIFTTIADWSFVVSLKFDTIEGQTYNRICFNVLL